MAEDLERLRRLLPHWIEHSQEHAQTFREWAHRARALSLEEVATGLERAATLTEESAAALRDGLDRIEPSPS